MFEIKPKGALRIKYQILNDGEVVRTYKYTEKISGESLEVCDQAENICDLITIKNLGSRYEFTKGEQKFTVDLSEKQLHLGYQNKEYIIRKSDNVAYLLEDYVPMAKLSNFDLSYHNLINPYEGFDAELIELILIIFVISDYKKFENMAAQCINLIDV